MPFPMSSFSLISKDLSKEPPRSPRHRIGGYVLLARALDKGRAALAGTPGEYRFDCPLDRRLFDFKGVSGTEIRTLLAGGATDEQMAAWLNTHGTPRTVEEVAAWGDAFVAQRPHDDPERREWFAQECARLGLDPARTTFCEYMEEDDRRSYLK